MGKIAELVNEAIAHLDKHQAAREALPFELRNLVTQAYNALIDVQVDGMDAEEALELVDAAGDAIAECVNAKYAYTAVAEQVGFLVRPVSAVERHLRFVIGCG